MDKYWKLKNLLVEAEALSYQLYKQSDEEGSVHLTMIQMDVASALDSIEDLLGDA